MPGDVYRRETGASSVSPAVIERILRKIGAITCTYFMTNSVRHSP